MRPGDRTIRDELRREAAQVKVPDAMWEQISRQLDLNQARAERRKRLMLRTAQWKPALALAAAAIFWLMVIPAASRMDGGPSPEPASPPAAAAPVQGQDSLSIRTYKQARLEKERNVTEDGPVPDGSRMMHTVGVITAR